MSAAGDSPSSSGDVEDAAVNRILGALDNLDAVPVAERAGLLLGVHDLLSSELTPEQKLRAAGVHGAP